MGLTRLPVTSGQRKSVTLDYCRESPLKWAREVRMYTGDALSVRNRQILTEPSEPAWAPSSLNRKRGRKIPYVILHFLALCALLLIAGCEGCNATSCTTLDAGLPECPEGTQCGYVGTPPPTIPPEQSADGEWPGVQKFCIHTREVGSSCTHDTQCVTDNCNDPDGDSSTPRVCE